MKAFITATGTDIGKTHVACGLLRELRRQGKPALALKPVVSGWDPATSAQSDPGRLLAAQGLEADPAAIAAIAPWRFAAPVSPDHAAALEGRSIDYAALLAFCRDRLQQPGAVLIEGIGGVMVPLDDSRTVLDLCADLIVPVILVAGTYLGTLSHTLTALAVLRARNLRGVVVMNATQCSAIGPDIIAATIERLGRWPVVAVPRDLHDARSFARIVQVLERQDRHPDADF